MRGHLTERGLPLPAAPVWRSYVGEWDRALRAANRPWTTRYNYQLAVCQLAAFLAAEGADDSDAAEDPTGVGRRHVERFLAWMIETRSASTALNKYKGGCSSSSATWWRRARCRVIRWTASASPTSRRSWS